MLKTLSIRLAYNAQNTEISPLTKRGKVKHYIYNPACGGCAGGVIYSRGGGRE